MLGSSAGPSMRLLTNAPPLRKILFKHRLVGVADLRRPKDRPRRVVPIGCLYLYYMRGIDRVRQQSVQSRFTPALPTTSWHHSATGTAVQGWSRIASDQVQRSEKRSCGTVGLPVTHWGGRAVTSFRDD